MTPSLLKAIDQVLKSEDNTGCSDDLTVVSMQAIKKLKKEYDKAKKC